MGNNLAAIEYQTFRGKAYKLFYESPSFIAYTK